MIIFHNPGTLDLRGLKTFGLTSKDSTQIGRFGTGLKYAVATILRNGGCVEVTTGGERYRLGVTAEDFRGKEHQTVTLDGEPLPFTTTLGRGWEPWMAFRELYANALDEGGGVCRDAPASGAEITAISVDLPAFEAIFDTIEEHFIHGETPIWQSADIEVYSGRSAFVFYRGIAIMKLKKPSAYRYNLKDYVDLTEDRTAKYPWYVDRMVAKSLATISDDVIAAVVVDGKGGYESGLDFMDASSDGAVPSSQFIVAAARKGGDCNPTAARLAHAFLPNPNPDSAEIISPEQPGGAALIVALRLLRALNEPVSKARWALIPDMWVHGGFSVKGGTIFLCNSVFNDQAKMNAAVFSGWNSYNGGDWMRDKLLSMAAEVEERA